MGAVFFIKVVEIWAMLEVVGVKIASFQGVVRLYIVGEFNDVEGVAFFCKSIGKLVEDDGVWDGKHQW